MGCDAYRVAGWNSERQEEVQSSVKFSEADDDFGCLCTFPGTANRTLDADTVRSLALLGAAVVLASLHNEDTNIFIPHGLPQWIVDEVRRLLPVESLKADQRGAP